MCSSAQSAAPIHRKRSLPDFTDRKLQQIWSSRVDISDGLKTGLNCQNINLEETYSGSKMYHSLSECETICWTETEICGLGEIKFVNVNITSETIYFVVHFLTRLFPKFPIFC